MKKAELKEYYKNKYMLSPKEIAIKTVILRVISSFVTASLVLLFTGSIGVASIMFATDFVVKMFLYYYYEISWFRFRKLWASKESES